jgi:hypothetical protein
MLFNILFKLLEELCLSISLVTNLHHSRELINHFTFKKNLMLNHDKYDLFLQPKLIGNLSILIDDE